MSKYPNVWTISGLAKAVSSCSAEINGRWVPARPLGFASFSSRVRIAWLVFTGRADALIWPEGQ